MILLSAGGIPQLYSEETITNLICKRTALKGQCHEINNFLKVLKIKSVLSVYAPIVFKFFFLPGCDENKR
jgi:hypothetical protein